MKKLIFLLGLLCCYTSAQAQPVTTKVPLTSIETSCTAANFIAGNGSAVSPQCGTITTTGTSGAATLSGGVLNIPQYVGSGGGTVLSVSVVTANGLAGTVATSTTTPAITLTTSVTGVLKGNGTAISAATAGTDYQVPISLTTTGTSGAATFATGTLNIPQYQQALTLTTTGSSGAATLSSGTLNIPQYSGGGSSGTVTSVSVVTANGLAGTVATSTTTPAITLTTTVTGILKGNGTTISGATAGTDYQTPISLTTSGSSGAATFIGATLNIPQYVGSGGGGLNLINTLTASSSATLSDTTSFTSTYNAYLIVFENVLPATINAHLQMLYSTNGGSSWISANYSDTSQGGGGTASYISIANITQTIVFTGTYKEVFLSNTAGGLFGQLLFSNPNSTTGYGAVLSGQLNQINGTGTLWGQVIGSNATTSPINGIKFSMSSGNIASGAIKIYGLSN